MIPAPIVIVPAALSDLNPAADTGPIASVVRPESSLQVGFLVANDGPVEHDDDQGQKQDGPQSVGQNRRTAIHQG